MFADTRSPQSHTAYFSLCGPCQLSFQVSFKVEVDFALFFFCFCVRVICFLFRYISKFFFCFVSVWKLSVSFQSCVSCPSLASHLGWGFQFVCFWSKPVWLMATLVVLHWHTTDDWCDSSWCKGKLNACYVAVSADDDIDIDGNVDPLMLKMIFTKKQSHSLIHGSVTIPCN